jgi:hypothetical protein
LPRCGTFSIELISPAPWETLDGYYIPSWSDAWICIDWWHSYEFPQYEQLTALACIPLESSSTELGLKNFIVAATSVDRGEDLAARGAVSTHLLIDGYKFRPFYSGLCVRNRRSRAQGQGHTRLRTATAMSGRLERACHCALWNERIPDIIYGSEGQTIAPLPLQLNAHTVSDIRARFRLGGTASRCCIS